MRFIHSLKSGKMEKQILSIKKELEKGGESIVAGCGMVQAFNIKKRLKELGVEASSETIYTDDTKQKQSGTSFKIIK